jgi:hypothetical protein
MAADNYITLVVSLPYLPPFEKAERLPITRLRLQQRLNILSADHAQQLANAEALISWRPTLLKPKSDKDMAARYRVLLQNTTHPLLRDFVAFRIDQQTVVAALRLREAGLEAETFAQLAGLNRWTRHIVAHWNDADFQLSFMYPWLPEALRLLKARDACGLDRLLMTVVWQRLSRMSDSNPFGFEAVFAFVFKWDMLQAWFARDPIKAKSRFQEIITEVRND